MEYYIKDLNGSTHTVQSLPTDTIKHVKHLAAGFMNLPRKTIKVEHFYLTNNDHVLYDENILLSENFDDLATFHVNIDLLGGGKKRKKKTYATPKKSKHKKKKVKLAVLNYYKVQEGTNQITRLRKECPSETCGAGVFMANHKTRNYCGRCGSTYFMKKEEVSGGKRAYDL